MEKELLALLVDKFPGVRKDGLTYIANILSMSVGSKDEAEALVDKLTAEGVNAKIAEWRKSADEEIRKATDTREKNLRDKFEFKEKSQSPDSKTPPIQEDITAEALEKIIAKSINDATKDLRDQVASLKGEAVSASRKERLTKELANAPEAFRTTVMDGFEGRQFASEDDFSAYLEKVKGNAASLTQDLANSRLRNHAAPDLGKTNKDGVSAAVESYLKKDAEGADLGGKKL